MYPVFHFSWLSNENRNTTSRSCEERALHSTWYVERFKHSVSLKSVQGKAVTALWLLMPEKPFISREIFRLWGSMVGERGKSAHFQSNPLITKEENLNSMVMDLAFPSFHLCLHMVMNKNILRNF